ncbi:MAG: M20/M25/M40 family metallo-hydrolase [Gemmatimonadetes bacterium]|nr:M20/M25/M40 family metallo-hydrolase [Gemmatimonadota bacterium]
MRPPIALPLLPLLLAACANGGPGSPDIAPDVARAAATITPADMIDRIGVLADDSLLGRDTPSPGLESAARYIAAELAASGFRPAGEEGWMQWYPYPLEGLDTRSTRLDLVAGATHTFEYGEDFYAEPGPAPDRAVGAVWVGDDLRVAAGDLRDRVAIVRLSGLPTQARGGERFPQDVRARIAATRAAAADAGAAGVVFIMEAGIGPADVAALAGTAAAPRRALGGQAAGAPPAALFVTRDAARRLFRAGGLDATEQLARTDVDRPVPLAGVSFRIGAPFTAADQARAPNVVGVLPGSDSVLRDTYIVLSAHMDHVGVGRPDETGDSIYNGADDDASGTATLLEVAEALAALPAPPARSVLILAVSGEEKGLLGSRWFSDHPTVPLEGMVANLNIDMIGRNAPDSIVVIGREYSSLGQRVDRVARRSPDLGLVVSDDPWPEERFFFRSDHFNFARKEIPALFFFAGTHEDYHRPGDEVDGIDGDKAARVARLVFLLTHELAQDPAAPEWSASGLAEVRRLTGQRRE